MEHIFTFGGGHTHPVTGIRLENRFVVMKDMTAEEARVEMFMRFGKKWGFQYTSRQDAEVERFELIELKKEDWPPLKAPA